MNSKLVDEINSFQNIWYGGFRTGYNDKRNQKDIENYLQNNITGKCFLEIGCGGGQWSKYIYNLQKFDKLYCIDVLSEEHNKFWDYVGNEKKDKIKYFQVNDFLLDCIPDNSLDYVFSYDVFCHISYSGQNEYIKNLYKKCKPLCKLLIMYADVNKYFISEPENIYIQQNHKKCYDNDKLKQLLKDDCDCLPEPGIWYWIGIDKFINLCEKHNFVILNKDLNIDKTNPITLFTKT